MTAFTAARIPPTPKALKAAKAAKCGATTTVPSRIVRKVAVKEADVSKLWNSQRSGMSRRRSFASMEHEYAELSELVGFFAVVRSLDTPEKIQAWLDKVPYYKGRNDYTVAQAWRLGRFDCSSGSLFAAYCLDYHGLSAPLLMGLDADPQIDDGHMLAVYKVDTCGGSRWGAVSKSGYTGLRGRDPVYASVRELAMSYFEFHVNKKGVKSLRSFSSPVNINKVDPNREWLIGKGRSKMVTRATNDCPHRCLPAYFRKAVLKPLKGATLRSQVPSSH